jgi:hypothetical protein
MTRGSLDDIVTDQLTSMDWKKILKMDLNPVHRAYLIFFRDNQNTPVNRIEAWEGVAKNNNFDEKDYASLEQVASALGCRKKNPFRIRAVSKTPSHLNQFRVVKIRLPYPSRASPP